MKFVQSIQLGSFFQVGPNSVYEEGSFDIDPEIFELGIPILGICYGMQLLTHKLGGKVVPAGDAGNREYGQSELTLTESSALFCRHTRQTIGLDEPRGCCYRNSG